MYTGEDISRIAHAYREYTRVKKILTITIDL